MSNRSARNIKSSGQAFYRRQAETLAGVLEYEARASVQFGPRPYMRAECYGPDVAVTHRKHRNVERETALAGELGVRIHS